MDNYNKTDNHIEKYLEEKEFREELLKEINKFDEANKEIFLRRFFLDYSIKDISRLIGISENAVSTRIKRGREKLIAKLKGEVI